MKIGDKILTELDKQRKPKKELAEYIGVKPASISDWSDSDNLRFWNVVKASEFLGLSLNYLAYGKEPTIPTEYKKLISSYQKLSPENQKMALRLMNTMYDVQTENERRKNIKIIQVKFMQDTASAGQGVSLWNDGDGEYIDVIETPDSLEADYAVRVEGESMLPDYHDGDVVLVKEQSDIEIGQVGIFTINNSKGYIKEYGEDRLISRNPEYDDIIPTDDTVVMCNGLVLGVAELP